MRQSAVRTRRAVLVALFAALTLGILTIYCVGVPWFSWNLAFYQNKPVPAAVIWKFAAVYLPLDLLKAALLLPLLRIIRARGGLVPGR